MNNNSKFNPITSQNNSLNQIPIQNAILNSTTNWSSMIYYAPFQTETFFPNASTSSNTWQYTVPYLNPSFFSALQSNNEENILPVNANVTSITPSLNLAKTINKESDINLNAFNIQPSTSADYIQNSNISLQKKISNNETCVKSNLNNFSRPLTNLPIQCNGKLKEELNENQNNHSLLNNDKLLINKACIKNGFCLNSLNLTISSPEKFDEIEKTNHKNINNDRNCNSLQMETPIVVGDYSNLFDVENPNLFQQKMRDAIHLSRYLALSDSFGFCKRPVHRSFLIRNLSYMKKHKQSNQNNTNYPKKCEKIKILSVINKNDDVFIKEKNNIQLMPTTVKFNFIRNNLCFGDQSAIVQCFNASEIDYNCKTFQRIPSATFDMKVNEKLSHISIDLPDNFNTAFTTESKSRNEYFVVRVVFRYEDSEVGGGKRLRKVPSRQLLEKNLRVQNKFSINKITKKFHKVVMFGIKKIISCSADYGLQVVHGETSIVLHTSEDLKIENDSNIWMEDPLFLGKILRLQRKTYDNPFMSIQVQNMQDEEEDSSEDEGSINNQTKNKIEQNIGLNHEKKHNIFNSTFYSKNLNEDNVISEKFAFQFVNNLRKDENMNLQTNFQFNLTSLRLEKEKTPSLENKEETINENYLNLSQSLSKTDTEKVIRVFNTSYMCFFCLSQMHFKTLSSLGMHLKMCHLRFNFEFDSKIQVTKTLTLPGFIVSFNENYDNSCEVDPICHYIKNINKIYIPKKCLANLEPIWIVIKGLAKKLRDSWKNLKQVENIELYNTSLFKDSMVLDGGILNGMRYSFEPPTKINHQWMLESNSRKLNEITDLHLLERRMMELWNEFVLNIRITLLGRNMLYKASRVFVETKRDVLNTDELKMHFLFHLTNLVNSGCLDDDERYDIFRRLELNYNPLLDNAHFIKRQFDLLNQERTNNSKYSSKNRSLKNLTAIAHDDELNLKIEKINCLDDLRAMFPFASTRRLEKIWKFIDNYTFNDFTIVSNILT